MSLLLLIVAIVLFLLAAFGVTELFGQASTIALGFVAFAASFLPLGSIAWPVRSNRN